MSELIDFGMNTFSYIIAFKYPYFEPNSINRVVADFLEKDPKIRVTHDQQTNEVQVPFSYVEPYSQVRLSPNRLTIWCGWKTSLSKWKDFRQTTLSILTKQMEINPHTAVFGVMAETTFTVPNDKLNEDSLPFRNYLELVHKYLPTKYPDAESINIAMSGDNDSVELAFSGDIAEPKTNIVVRHIRKVFPQTISFHGSLTDHSTISDENLDSINQSLLTKLIL